MLKGLLSSSLLWIVLLLGQESFGQVAVQGTIKDANGPVPGANIIVKGSNLGTQSGPVGDFTISVPDANATLVVSFIGYKTEEVPLAGRTSVEVTIQSGQMNLDEMVVVGYGAQKRKDITGSVSSITAETIHSRPITTAGEAIQGRVPGVQVMNNSAAPGGNVSIRIRGSNSISATNEPLYVVDGIIGVDGLQYINPNDIESMEILKDASSTSIYGARGANGVVLISTKRGKSGKAQISYSGQFGLATMARKIPMLNASQYMKMENEAYINSGLTPQFTQDQINNPEFDTDWQKEATRTAFRQNHQLGIYGGNEQNRYGVSLGFLDEQGIMLGSQLNRVNLRLNLDNQVTKKLKVSTSLTINRAKDNKIDTDNGGLNASRAMLEMFPFLPVKYADGTYSNSSDHPGGEGTDNPVAILTEIKDVHTINRVMGNLFAEYELAQGLKLKVSAGADINDTKRNYYSPSSLRRSRAERGYALVGNVNSFSWQNENTLSYNKLINNRHELNLLAGITWQKFKRESVEASSRGFNDDFFQYNNLGVGDRPNPPSSNAYQWSLNSYLGRINYFLDDKYLFTFTTRIDGSSKFGASNKYGFFPSGAFAWRMSQEKFMQKQKLINDLKFRASYGITGNQEVGVYQSISALSTFTYIIGGQRAVGLGPGTVPNPGLKWEKTSQTDIGVDLSVLDNRITFTADAYYKETRDLLLNTPLPFTTGYSSIFTNIGKVANKGIELMVSTENTRGAISWTTDANISFNRNKVLALGPEEDDIFPGPNFVTETNILRVGEPIGSLWGWTRDGIFQNMEEVRNSAQPNARPGDIRYKDINGDGVIDSKDQAIIGNTNPKYIFGLSNRISYKKFTLDIQIQGVQGNDNMNLNPIVLEDRQTQANSYATLLDRWTPENPSNTIAQVRKNSDLRLSTRHVESGAFVRGKNLSVSYRFMPESSNWYRSANLSLSVQNFFLITKYGGYNPEVSTYSGNFGQGIEFSSYPTPRMFTASVNITL
jgi:TonB-linked SusC/RagA family outer membrane protein